MKSSCCHRHLTYSKTIWGRIPWSVQLHFTECCEKTEGQRGYPCEGCRDSRDARGPEQGFAFFSQAITQKTITRSTRNGEGAQQVTSPLLVVGELGGDANTCKKHTLAHVKVASEGRARMVIEKKVDGVKCRDHQEQLGQISRSHETCQSKREVSPRAFLRAKSALKEGNQDGSSREQENQRKSRPGRTLIQMKGSGSHVNQT